MYKTVNRFSGDRAGNFAILAGVLSLPLLLGVGMALDYSTISRTRSNLQNSLDSAVLAIAREGEHITDARAKELAGLFTRENTDWKVTNLQVTHVGTSFKVEGTVDAPIAFGPLFGYKQWPVTASSTADIAYASYEVGLVLDTTGSMAGGKLAAMKDAVDALVTDMSEQVGNKDKLKFAVVPFSSFVNVGPGYGPSFDKDGKQIAGTGAKWLDLKGESDIPQSELSAGASRFQLYENLGQKWPGCVETRDSTDATADPSKPETLFVPAFAIDEPDTGGFFNSYITSDAKIKDDTAKEKKARWKKYGVKTDAAGEPLLGGLLDPLLNLVGGLLGGNTHPTVPINVRPVGGYGKTGPTFACVTEPIIPLTNDYSTIKSKVNALTANGNTNIMEGVSWGMRVLSPGEPFAQGKPAAPGLQKIMVVLTDGSNVMGNASNALGSSYSALGYLVDGRVGISVGGSGATNAAMNTKTLEACTNAKAQGIEVYTIRLEEPNVATGTMLKECASAPENFIDVPSRAQLDEAFSKIKDRIFTVRISS